MPRFLAFALLMVGCGAFAADIVILPDGFVLQGKHYKEKELVIPPGGGPLVMDKAQGFDMMEDGARSVVFSRHVSKGGKVEQVTARPDYTPLKMSLNGPKGKKKSIAVDKAKVGEFNSKWEQWITGTAPPTPDLPNGGPTKIHRQITRLDPYMMGFDSVTHQWQPKYQTSEYPPEQIRKFLGTHPDLKDPPGGKLEADRRLKVATFLKDVSLTDPSANGYAYLQSARKELDKLKEDVPTGMSGEDTAKADKLRDELGVAETKRVCEELEAATTGGRWMFARQLVGGYTPSALDPKEALRFASLKTTVETAFQKFEQTARLLDELLREVGGPPELLPFGGGLAAAGPVARQSPAVRSLFPAATGVRAELHPDTVGRLELFVSQADAKRRFEGPNAVKPEALLALAVSGALKGKNGADPDPAAAVTAWNARLFVTRYLRADTTNARLAALAEYRSTAPAGTDELSQVVALSPPPDPLDPARPGAPVPPTDADGASNVVTRVTPPDAAAPRGFNYVLRLPVEWHPGRSYPVLLALTDPSFSAEKLVGRLQEYADRYGYVVVAPKWSNQFGPREYDYSGIAHPAATVVLRDVFRRVRCDPDKVFAFGYGNGADFALDLGLAHPDLFAGVVANGAVPPTWLTTSYWRNAQKLPMYFVCGEMGAEFAAVRPLFQKWMPAGYPAIASVYRGRGSPDFFAVELPRVFDWLGRKTRVRGAGSLKLGPGGVDPWQVLREADDRFYWVGVGTGGLQRQNLLVGKAPGQAVQPARFQADIGRAGGVEIKDVVGVRKFVIWLERDLIDWSKPLTVTVNGKTPIGYKPQLLKPDIGVMLEELYRTGDTKMLYLGKVEVDGPG